MDHLGGLLWTQQSWLEQASSWIDRELHQQSIKQIGSIKQLRVRHWSTILQVPTSVGSLYFKAVVSDLAYEAALTQALSHRYPHCMPQILAIVREQGWLLMHDGGMMLRETLKTEDDIQHWENLLPIYAKVQQDSARYLQELLELGVPDRRLASLPAKFQQLLADTEILALNHSCGLSLLEYQCLQNKADLLVNLCEQLATFGIPETLHHGDLHDKNVFFSNEQYMFFDWGDSSVTHPFFSLHSTYSSLEKRFNLRKNSLWFKQLRKCYLDEWVEYETKERLEEAFELAQQLSPILAILRWLPVLSSMDATNRNKYIEAVPDLLREFLSMIQKDDDHRKDL
ncbi:MAG: phosphotransferase [Oscillatoriophycideae cyanobacterium NC_groundwater_1537_Pr4_S-0.65um_50_18]|nr:phosphotransferase [Oscillatoriophycideae cyanobacterium NC_groundwater_1537_Pr4_S-0.65um_50_18]